MATTNTPRPPAPPPAAKGRKGKPRPKRNPFWYGVKQFLLGVTLLVLVAVITFLACMAYQLKDAPSSIDINYDPAGRTFIFSSDGVMLAKLYTENREKVTIDKIPKDLQNATVAFEDRRFYTHSGIDFPGIGRALWQNVKHGDVRGQGGSTLTQQLARNMGVEGLNRDKTLGRKLHEMLVAAQIEKSYTKQQILEMYLNQVNYGAGAYGVQAAAQTYFGMSVSKCDLSHCALLAGLPNRPAYLNPYRNKKAALAQRDIVLSHMLSEGYITPQQCADAKAEFIHLAAPRPPKQGSQIYHAPFFVNYVVDQMRQKYGPDYLGRGNLRVETTLNWPMQQAAEASLVSGIERAGGRGPTQGCLVCLDQKTGQIKAMVGGTDYSKSQFNIVTQARRQPGSSFKAVVYAAAIDSHVVTEQTRVYDAPQTYSNGGKPYTPRDDNGYSYNHVSLRTAMAYSINVPAVKVIKMLGPRTAIQYARLMGVTSPLDPVLSLALGSSGVTPLEMATVYATIANGGNHPQPTPFTRLADLSGATIEDLPPAVESRVLQPSTVAQLDDMLRAVVTEPRATGNNVADVSEARGKTGTTQGHKDVWFVGYDPNLTCAVWAGHPVYTKNGKAASYGRGNAGQCVGVYGVRPHLAGVHAEGRAHLPGGKGQRKRRGTNRRRSRLCRLRPSPPCPLSRRRARGGRRDLAIGVIGRPRPPLMRERTRPQRTAPTTSARTTRRPPTPAARTMPCPRPHRMRARHNPPPAPPRRGERQAPLLPPLPACGRGGGGVRASPEEGPLPLATHAPRPPPP